MRPGTPLKGGEGWKKRSLIIGAVIIGIVIAILVISNWPILRSEEGLYFSKVTLQDKKISTEENTLLEIEVYNPENRFYENIDIQIATRASKLEITPTNPGVESKYENRTENNEMEYLLTVSTPLGLAIEEKTRLYTFYVGGSLSPGVNEATFRFEALLIANDKPMDNRELKLELVREE